MTSSGQWCINMAQLEALSMTREWRRFERAEGLARFDPNTSAFEHAQEIYGAEGKLSEHFEQPYPGQSEMLAALLDNDGGGVPAYVIRRLVSICGGEQIRHRHRSGPERHAVGQSGRHHKGRRHRRQDRHQRHDD